MNIKHLFPKVCLTAMLPLASCLSLAQPSSAEDNAFLWTIESPNNTVYLLGSIHLVRATDYRLAQPIDYLVVVGATHLVGDGSVVKLLRDQGYTVTGNESPKCSENLG